MSRIRLVLNAGILLIAAWHLHFLILHVQPEPSISATIRRPRPLTHQISIVDQAFLPPPSPPPLATFDVSEAVEASIEARTKPFPVVLLAHARATRLNLTLTSLRAVRGLDASRVFILQDGTDPDVAAVVHASGFRHATLPAHREPTVDDLKSGSTIAKAYQNALTMAFDELTDDEAVVVVEDDLFFSPDLMEYFLAGYHVMKGDPTLWCVSAWNDNGFHGLVSPTQPKRLLRTGYFPGLGWLLTRSLYKQQLEPGWPTEHWDHWMRSERVHKTSRGRECLIPSVPRTFHHGARGTFMSPVLHSQFFAQIATSRDASIRWPPSEWPELRARTTLAAYERALRERIAAARPLTDLKELLRVANGNSSGSSSISSSSSSGSSSSSSSGGGGGISGTLSLWYTQPPRSTAVTVFKELAILLGLWHELRRAQHNGVHELWCAGSTRLLLVNTLHMRNGEQTASPYADLVPASPAVWTSGNVIKAAAKKAFRKLKLRERTSVCRLTGPTFDRGETSAERRRASSRH